MHPQFFIAPACSVWNNKKIHPNGNFGSDNKPGNVLIVFSLRICKYVSLKNISSSSQILHRPRFTTFIWRPMTILHANDYQKRIQLRFSGPEKPFYCFSIWDSGHMCNSIYLLSVSKNMSNDMRMIIEYFQIYCKVIKIWQKTRNDIIG